MIVSLRYNAAFAFLLTVASSQAQSDQSTRVRTIAADQFLDQLSDHPIFDSAEEQLSSEIYHNLNAATSNEAGRVVLSILQHVRSDKDENVRAHAVQFLLALALRPDGSDLLLSHSEEIAPLLLDKDSGMQQVSVAIAYYIVGSHQIPNAPFLAALTAAIQNKMTPQDTSVNMIGLALYLGYLSSNDSSSVLAVLKFLHRDDLTSQTWVGVLHGLSGYHDVSEQINSYLCKTFGDPSPRVRAAAVIAFAAPNSIFHRVAKSRVEKISSDMSENAQVRQLAIQALAGQTNLNPNIQVP